MRGQALKQDRCGILEADRVGKRHDAVGGCQRVRGICAGCKDESDTIAGVHVGHIGADGLDNAGAFKPERER